MLDINNSRYVDFQKVRIQETQAELPRGSIPRRFVDMYILLLGNMMVESTMQFFLISINNILWFYT